MLNKIICLVFLVGVVLAKDFVIQNNLDHTVWVAILGSSIPNNGGFALDAGQQVTVTVETTWSGRIWGRSGCSFDASGNGPCDTGDCGGHLECNGAGGVPPASLAEFTLGPDLDFYDVSLVDGFNLPVQVTPLTKTVDPNNKYSCGVGGCTNDLLANCPDELRELNGAGQTVACKCACLVFGTDLYCCRGDHGTPETCKSSDWPVNYAKYFKDACPSAYSYAYDDQSSTYTCSDSGYKIQFG